MDQKANIEGDKIQEFVNTEFDKAMPTLVKFLEIPSQSCAFDPEWNTNGLLLSTATLLRDWILSQQIQGLKLELLHDQGYSPFLYGEVEASNPGDSTILFYGHMDKQPPFEGWKEGFHPYKPVVVDGKLYGRGGADDGYSIFATALAIKACQVHKLKHPRIIMLFEADEESSSGHVEYYIEKLRPRIGEVELVICLDSGCSNYDQLWLTTTLRGACLCQFTVQVLTEGVHSGSASGIVPSSFRIARELLDRIDCSKTGEVHPDFQVVVPGQRYIEAQKAVETIGDKILDEFPWITPQMQPTVQDKFQAYMNKVWKAQLSVVGAEGLPVATTAGNVLRPSTTLKLSLRLPPTLCPKKAEETMINLLTKNVPYGATVKIDSIHAAQGWNCPENKDFVNRILDEASNQYFKKPLRAMGEGVTIPLMNVLEGLYPKSQFIVTGVLGPGANAHGPNEFLHIDFCKKLIASMAHFVARSYDNFKAK